MSDPTVQPILKKESKKTVQGYVVLLVMSLLFCFVVSGVRGSEGSPISRFRSLPFIHRVFRLKTTFLVCLFTLLPYMSPYSIYTRGIQWNEKNLQQNEEEKVPRMKIDEPKTPYNKEYQGTFIS